MDSGMVGSTRATLLPINHDADVALVGQEVQSPFERRQVASRSGLRVLYNRSIKILWRTVLFRRGDLLPLGVSWVVHQRNEYLGH